jgi:hypothetical protein
LIAITCRENGFTLLTADGQMRVHGIGKQLDLLGRVLQQDQT